MKTIYLLVLCALVGCSKAPLGQPVPTDNPELRLGLMFTHDGCRVYRFTDGGRNHYFTDCRGSVSTTQSCGKNCRYEESVETP
jgi:hypothetical protein